MTPASKDFEDQVKTCLTHFYDQHVLLDQPLIQALSSGGDGIQRAHHFRKQIIGIINSLKPSRDTTINSKDYRHYLILQQRYIEEQQHAEIIPQLALSERQYYREHREAVNTLTQILWERVNEGPDLSVQTEARRIYDDSPVDEVDIQATIDSIYQSVEPIVQRLKITLQMGKFPSAKVRLNRDILRQLIIWLLSQLVEHNIEVVSMEGKQDHRSYQISFQPAPTNYAPTSTLNTFIKLLNASLDLQPDAIVLKLPMSSNNRSVLLIDDNPDTPKLFRRLMVNMRYELLSANTASDGIRMAREMQPLAILLDVMMPESDGWEVLNSLKSHPETLQIPVVICSVLDVKQLSLSLGADGYLHKPPGIDDLRSALENLESVSP